MPRSTRTRSYNRGLRHGSPCLRVGILPKDRRDFIAKNLELEKTDILEKKNHNQIWKKDDRLFATHVYQKLMDKTQFP